MNMRSLLVVLTALAAACGAAAQSNCSPSVPCGVGGRDPLNIAEVPPGYRILERVPPEFCYGLEIIGSTTQACADDVPPDVQCLDPSTVIITRQGRSDARTIIIMSATCQYNSNGPQSTGNKKLAPVAKKLS